MNRETKMKNGKVLFVIHDVYQDFNNFPLGIAYLASMLKVAGAHVDIYCQDLYHYSNNELACYLDRNEYDLIGVGFMAARFKETILELCRVINAHKKNAWLVLGGHGPSPIPEYMLDTTQADIVAIGEAEHTIIELLEAKINGTHDAGKITGIAWRLKNKVVVNKRRPRFLKLDEMPFPAWESFPFDDYSNSIKILDEQPPHEKSLVFTSARGCINECNFCYRMEKGIRLRSIDNVIEELRILTGRYRIHYFQIFDEMFILNKKRVLEFEEKLAKNKLEIRYFCDARVDILDKEIVESLKRSGCRFMNFGLESADNSVLRQMNKNTTVEQNIAALELVLSCGGIGVGLNILWGNIGDNEETLWAGVELIKKYNSYKQIRTIRPPTPYPGCQLYYTAIEQGLLNGPADFFDKFVNSDLYLVNFTQLPLKRYYELLFQANKELITDHYRHTTHDMEEAAHAIEQFRDLYNGKNQKFRGIRKYSKEEKAMLKGAEK